MCCRQSWPRRGPVRVAAAVEMAATIAVAIELAAVTAEVLAVVLAVVLALTLAAALAVPLPAARHWPAAPAVKLAVTQIMPCPLPCRGSPSCCPGVSAGFPLRQAALIVSHRNVPNIFAHTPEFTHCA